MFKKWRVIWICNKKKELNESTIDYLWSLKRFLCPFWIERTFIKESIICLEITVNFPIGSGSIWIKKRIAGGAGPQWRWQKGLFGRKMSESSAAQRASKEQHPISACGRAEMIYMRRFTELSLDSFRNVSADFPPSGIRLYLQLNQPTALRDGRRFLLFRTLHQTPFVNSGKWPHFEVDLRLAFNSDHD